MIFYINKMSNAYSVRVFCVKRTSYFSPLYIILATYIEDTRTSLYYGMLGCISRVIVINK